MGIGQQMIIHRINPTGPVSPENLMRVTNDATIVMTTATATNLPMST